MGSSNAAVALSCQRQWLTSAARLRISHRLDDQLFGRACQNVSCVTPTTPWFKNDEGLVKLHRQLPKQTIASYMDATTSELQLELQQGEGTHQQSVLTYSHVALGLMAQAVPHLRSSKAPSPASATEACMVRSSKPDLLACMASTWLPPSVDVLLLHDCTVPCLEELRSSTRVGAASTSSARHCEAPRGLHGQPLLVHHRPFRHSAPPKWASLHEARFHRRCFYGPMHGSHAASYFEPGRFSPQGLKAQAAKATRIAGGSSNLTDKEGMEVAINPSHMWAKTGSLLLALLEELAGKLYYIKIDSDTTIEPTLLLRFLTAIHAHLPGQFHQPPSIAFGSSERMFHFAACEPTSKASQCGPDVSEHGHAQCLRGSMPWISLLRDAAQQQARGNATLADEHVQRQATIPFISYPAGMLYGLSRAALSRLVEAKCIERLATRVTCVERVGAPSTLIDDVSFGLCLHLHRIPRVQCDCFVNNGHRGQGFRCSAPISLHPAKTPREYVGFSRVLAARAGHFWGVNISSYALRWRNLALGTTSACQPDGTGCFPPHI